MNNVTKLKQFERVWYLDGGNMHPEVTARNAEYIRGCLEKIGFFRVGAPLQFGGDEALTWLYLFKKRPS